MELRASRAKLPDWKHAVNVDLDALKPIYGGDQVMGRCSCSRGVSGQVHVFMTRGVVYKPRIQHLRCQLNVDPHKLSA